jgi:hypothetical protein
MERDPNLSLNPFSDFLVQEVEKPEIIKDLFEDKHKPLNLDQFVGNKSAVIQLEKWVDEKIDNNPNNKPFVILYGPNGVGKTLLSRFVLTNFNVIVFDFHNMKDKKKFFERIKKCLSNISIEESLLQKKKTAFIIENVDKNLGDGIQYKKFNDLINKYHPFQNPIICINSSNDLKKKYNTPSKLLKIYLNYPETDELIIFCNKIAEKERLVINKSATELLIASSKYDIRKILHYMKILTYSKNKKITKKEIRKVLNFSESDVFFSAYEILDEIFNDDVERDINDIITKCYTDQPLIVDLIYSNLGYLDIETISESLDDISNGDIKQKLIYKKHAWELRDYVITDSCVSPLLRIRNNKTKKNYVIKKNQINNITWNTIKNNKMLTNIISKSKYTKLKKDELKFAFLNIIEPIINKGIKHNTNIENDIEQMKQLGFTVDDYHKMKTFVKQKAMNKKEKNKLNNYFEYIEK